MTNNINIVANAYVSVTLAPLADGQYRIEGFKKLRVLDPEVARLYHSQSECVVIDAQLGLRVAPIFMTFMKVGKIVGEEIIRQLEAAGEKLIEIEKKVAEYAAKAPVTIYVGGSEAADPALEKCAIGTLLRLLRDFPGLGEAGSEHKVCWIPEGGNAVQMNVCEGSPYRTSGSLFFLLKGNADLFKVVARPLKIEAGGFVKLRRDILGVGKKGSVHRVIENPDDTHVMPEGRRLCVRVLNPEHNEAAHLDAASVARGMVYNISGDGHSFEPVKGPFCTVLDCQHADGSEYSWYAESDDDTNYVPGDFVVVEHLSGKDDIVKVVRVREMSPTADDFPVCRVIGLA